MPAAPLKIKPADVAIPAEDPFANDLIGRKKTRDFLTEIIGRADDSFVLALDSPWGTGKTTFLRMWLQHLRGTGTRSIYFNAWENDFAADPLACLLGEITGLLKDNGATPKTAAHIKRARRLGARLLKRAIPIGARVLSAGLVDEQTFKQAHEALSDFAEKAAEDAIADYEGGKQLAAEFRTTLEKAVAAPARNDGDSGATRGPLVFVIDELDRCRPTFAIELLERAKHFFTVPGVVFVLGVDKAALARSLQTVYGVGFDSTAYLRRFIDFELQLGPTKAHVFVRSLVQRFDLNEYVDYVDGQMGLTGYVVTNLAAMFHAARVSLRAQEQTLARLSVLSRLNGFYEIMPFGVLPLLTLIASDPQLYESFTCGTIGGDELITRWTANRPELFTLLREHDEGRRFGMFLDVTCAYLHGPSVSEVGDRLYGPAPESATRSLTPTARQEFDWIAGQLQSKRRVRSIVNRFDLASQIS